MWLFISPLPHETPPSVAPNHSRRTSSPAPLLRQTQYCPPARPHLRWLSRAPACTAAAAAPRDCWSPGPPGPTTTTTAKARTGLELWRTSTPSTDAASLHERLFQHTPGRSHAFRCVVSDLMCVCVCVCVSD